MIRVGHIGLGRLGFHHARNLATKIKNVKLVALCDINEEVLKSVASDLNVSNTYTSFEEMISDNEIDAVSISSPSSFHTDQIIKAFEAGKHVFCEKPVAFELEECDRLVKSVNTHKDLVFFPAFMRRFDPSYRRAKELIDSGKIGEVFMVRSYSQDPIKNIEGAIKYGPHSGGEFLDMSVHDIDLCRWYLGVEPVKAWAIGGCYAFPEFKGWNDADNASCLLKFEKDKMAFLFAGRTAAHGYNVETEIMGTKGSLRIGSVPQNSLLEILDESGVRKECSQNFLERFEVAYLEEMEEFVSCVLKERKVGISVEDAVTATKIAYKCKESFEKDKLIFF